ncbi:MAG: type II secretion system F family protein [Candidatus Aenigmarchaeota archaeon]|nr:type II secretion system F family protein [Candidatus Aenigmarchaeota archaeon]
MRRFYKVIGEIVPYKNRLNDILRYAGMEDISPLEFSGFMFIYSSLLGIIVFFISYLFFGFYMAFGLGILSFVGFQTFLYIILVLVMDARTKQIEEVLADALQLMSANVRAGMTLDRAIWLSARPEFGPLEDEIKLFGNEVLGGVTMIDALRNIKNRVNSNLLDRTLNLMEEGVKSGGEMAHLLDETALDIRKIQIMRREIRSNVIMYSMFIMFASVLGAPLLFAVSVYFIEMIGGFWQETATDVPSQMSSGLMQMTGPQVDPTEMMMFSVACIILTTVFGALIIGLIQTGKEKRGLKYIPLLTGSGVAVFFLVRFAITSLFGSLLGF